MTIKLRDAGIALNYGKLKSKSPDEKKQTSSSKKQYLVCENMASLMEAKDPISLISTHQGHDIF